MKTKTKRIKKRNYKKQYKKHKTNKKYTTNKTHKIKRKYTKTRSHRKMRDILTLPGSRGVPLFTIPKKTQFQIIPVNQYHQYGNMIPGLRNM